MNISIQDEKELKKLTELMYLYSCAVKVVTTKIDILNENYKITKEHNPIEHVKSRVKSMESISKKMQKKGLKISADSIKNNLDDIAGIRIICSFANDVKRVRDKILKQQDVTLVKEKDYIENPKDNGYRSYHMIIQVPIYLVDKVEHVNVEIQIRTEAMDFWASLEHKANYKYNGDVPKHLLDEFKMCSEKIDEVDKRMSLIKDIIYLINN